MAEHALLTASRLAEAVESKDPFTRGHARAVSQVAAVIGQELGLRGDHLDLVEVAGLLHDIGYIDVAPDILTKPGRLTPTEFERIRIHPQVGADIVRSIPSLKDAADFVGHHHERCDGGGYPQGVRKPDITVEGRILAVAETYDALTAHRAHRAAFPPVKVIRALKTAARSQLDSELVEALLAIITRQAGGRSLETMNELPSLDEIVGQEQRRLRDTYIGISTNLSRIFDSILGHPTRRTLEADINAMLHRGGIQLTLHEGEVEDRLPSRAQPDDLATEYRAALAQQIARIEQWIGSRMTRFYLGAIIQHLGPEAAKICRAYRLCEVPAYEEQPQRVPDSPLILMG